MAISKDKKQQLVADLNELLSDAKMTVFAKYQGLTVAEMQELRKAARENNVKINGQYRGLQRHRHERTRRSASLRHLE